jgi:glutamate-1-semialdehyde 2,1-aminomutase/spore coat polysaccharide biosynthesis protein SpsF
MSVTDRADGIPANIKVLSHQVKYGNSEDIRLAYQTWTEGHFKPGGIAAVIVEPGDDPEYLEWLRGFCDESDIVLIFDEIITGFRYGLGGAQELHGVIPDLACFGKAMGNGMPISALVGKREIMQLMDSPDVFYSGTMFGETLSIAAAIATINKLERENIPDKLMQKGIKLEFEILKMRKAWELTDYVELSGWYTNMKIDFKDHPKISADQMRALFMVEMAQQGVLIINCFGLMHAHQEPEIRRILRAIEVAFSRISYFMKDGNIRDELGDLKVKASPLRKAS